MTTAHPHHDRDTNEAVNYAVNMGPRSTYRVYATDAQDQRRVLARVPVSRPAYMHSFGMTERFVILAEYPLTVNPLKLALGGRSFIESYEWQPERGTRFLVIDRRSGKVHTTAKADAFFCFHHVNAYEEGDDVVVDLVAFDDASVIDHLVHRPAARRRPGVPSQLRRYRIDPSARAAARGGPARPLDRAAADRLLTRERPPYRVVYAAGQRPDREPDWLNELVKFDIASGAVAHLARGRLLPRRAGVRGSSRARARGRRRDPERGLRQPREPLVPARPRRRDVHRAGPRGGAAPHPVRLSRAVHSRAERRHS